MLSLIDDDVPTLRPGVYTIHGASHLGGIFESSRRGCTARYGEGWEVVRLYDRNGLFDRDVLVGSFTRRFLYSWTCRLS